MIVLDDVEQTFNSQYHKGIQAVPIDVWYKKDTITYKPKNEVDELNIGSHVRVLVKSDIFNKKYNNKWSGDTFIVKSQDGVGYKLEGKQRKYFRWELLLVDKPKKNNNEIVNQLKDARINNKVKKVLKNLN